MKGKKICGVCQRIVAARSSTCECGHIFYQKKTELLAKGIVPVKQGRPTKRKRKFMSVDWRQLQQNDVIKVRGGPYFEIDNGREAERIPMGYRGKFIVHTVKENGILARGNKREGENAMCFIHMNGRYTTNTGITRRPHKIVKVLQ